MHEHRPFAVSEASRSLRGRRGVPGSLAPMRPRRCPGAKAKRSRRQRQRERTAPPSRKSGPRSCASREAGAARAGRARWRTDRCAGSGHRGWRARHALPRARAAGPGHAGPETPPMTVAWERNRDGAKGRVRRDTSHDPRHVRARGNGVHAEAREAGRRGQKKAAGKTAPGRAVRPDAPPAERTTRGPRIDIRTCRTALSRN